MATYDIDAAGTQRWYVNNELHRDNDLPAVILSDGTKYWYQFGKKHRDNGPAILHPNGIEEWYRMGTRHRDGGPAVINEGLYLWYSAGRLHRVDGPAVIYPDGKQIWYNMGTMHRADGPAIIHSNGGEEWYFGGQRHRVGGPALIYADGTEMWYYNGKLHRSDGPAVIFYNGVSYNYIHGISQSEGPHADYIRRRETKAKYLFLFEDLQRLTLIREATVNTSILARAPDIKTGVIHEFDVDVTVADADSVTNIDFKAEEDASDEDASTNCAKMQIIRKDTHIYAHINSLYYGTPHNKCAFYKKVKGDIAWGTFMLQLMVKIARVFDCLYITLSDMSTIKVCEQDVSFSAYNIKNGRSPWYEENDFYIAEWETLSALHDSGDIESALKSVVRLHYDYLKQIEMCYKATAAKFCPKTASPGSLCGSLSSAANTLEASKKLVSLAKTGDREACSLYNVLSEYSGGCLKPPVNVSSRIRFLKPELELPTIQEYYGDRL